MREAWESGRSVSKSSAGEAAVAQRAPVEHQAGTGWPAFHGAAYVHLELMTCCRFHELQIDHVIGFGKALRSTLRNGELEGTTKSFCVGPSVFDLSTCARPPAPLEGPGPLNKKTKTNRFLTVS